MREHARISRRHLLALGLAASLDVAAQSPTETLDSHASRFADRSTEYEIQRLTRATYASSLCTPPGRAVSRRSDFVVVASARTGTPQLLRIDLATGAARVLTAASALNTSAYTLSPDDRTLYYFDGATLRAVALSGRLRGPAELWHGTASPASLCASADGTQLYFAAPSDDAAHALWRVAINGRDSAPLVRQQTPFARPALSPRRALVSWISDGALWIAARDGTRVRKLETPAGRVVETLWSPDAQSVLYLHESGRNVTLREYDIDARADRELAATSQFACFARNANATVFAGAAGTKASPYIVLMLRSTRRELTLCEHRSTHAADTRLTFTPDSQRLLFQGDREGASVIYHVKLECLLEPTEG